jgi:hypothetical protein
MAQFLNTPWISTPIPGAYVNTTVISTASGLASSGVVLIMGEAAQGPNYSEVTLANNFFGPSAYNQVRAIYGSGPIVDAFAALSAPSNDPDISGTATSIYILKTNEGTQATASVPGYGTLTALNFGVAGNLFNYTVTSISNEVSPQVTGNTVPAFGTALDGDTFSIRVNGGASHVITLSSGSSSPVTPTESAAGQSAAMSAYTSLTGMTATPISATLDGQTLTPGVYSTGAASLAASGAGTLTFNGAGVYVIKTSSTLVTGSGGIPTMTLTGGATAANIYWVVGSSATINSGFSGTFAGNVIAEDSITDTLGGTVNGSLIALTGAVTLSAATVVNAQNSPLLNYAGSFGLLGSSGVTNTGSSVVTGNVGSSPTNSVTGFPPGTIVGAAHSNIAELITELNLLLPAGITASAGSAMNTLVFTMAAEGTPYASGFGQSFELIDSTPGDLAALGMTAGLITSSEEPAVEVSIINTTAQINETFNIAPAIALSVGYAGTTGTMTINSTMLTTTVTGGTGANLSIVLSQYTTVGQLAAFINTQPGYTATVGSSATSNPTSSLDHVTAIGIASTDGDQPGRVKNSLFTFQNQLNTSTAVGFTPTATSGLPVPGSMVFLTGGALGGTSANDIVNAIAQMGGIQVNIIVPLFSQDASKDITAGNTDPSSTYTIDAINELLKSHCIQFSTPTLKHNRMAILSINDTFANARAQAQSLASYRCSLTCQQVTQVNSAGVNQLFLPWYAAAVAAGTQCGGFYKSICNHLANIVSFQDPVGYDSGDPADVSEAIIAGLLVLTQNTSGILWVSDQTSFGLNSSFVYNSIQAVYLSDILALDLAQSFQSAIVGRSVADVTAASALSFLQQRFDFYKKLKMVTTSNDAPLGYKNASITLSAPTMTVNVEAKLTTSIYFVAINLALSAVQQSAS